MSQTIRKAKLAGAVTWSDASNFNGSVRLGLVSPTGYSFLSLEGQYPAVRLPEWTTCPIVDGVYDQNVSLIYTADMDPPTSRYWAFFYDLSGVLLNPSGVGPLTVTADPLTITVPTLTVPTAPSVAPTPQTIP